MLTAREKRAQPLPKPPAETASGLSPAWAEDAAGKREGLESDLRCEGEDGRSAKPTARSRAGAEGGETRRQQKPNAQGYNGQQQDRQGDKRAGCPGQPLAQDAVIAAAAVAGLQQ